MKKSLEKEEITLVCYMIQCPKGPFGRNRKRSLEWKKAILNVTSQHFDFFRVTFNYIFCNFLEH